MKACVKIQLLITGLHTFLMIHVRRNLILESTRFKICSLTLITCILHFVPILKENLDFNLSRFFSWET